MNMRRGFAAAALALLGAGGLAWAGDAERGRELYEGRAALPAVEGAPLAAGCVACHRPSGMGNFEGGVAVPPIAGPMLFRPLDRDAGHYFKASDSWRVRPAYDQASLGTLLRSGRTPDGHVLPATMPRYVLGERELDDLTAYLRTLSSSPPAGLDDGTVRIATISTPDADPSRRDAMLATLEHFVAQKNGQSRHEAHRSTQATRTREMVMYRKFRVWRLEHWALQGDASTWSAQLDGWQARQPVYAVVAGIGGAQWAPVDAFCERHRLPCLLPLVDVGAEAPNFYNLHYHAGVDADARLAAQTLKVRGLRRVALWGEAPGLTARVRDGLEREGIAVVESGADALVSLLPPRSTCNACVARAARCCGWPGPMHSARPGSRPWRRQERGAGSSRRCAPVKPSSASSSAHACGCASAAWRRFRWTWPRALCRPPPCSAKGSPTWTSPSRPSTCSSCSNMGWRT